MKRLSVVAAIIAALVALHLGIHPVACASEAKQGKAVTVKKVSGFKHPESVAYDNGEKVLYVGDFVSELKPLLKDGKGKISKVSLEGEILEDKFLPTSGNVLHKPKGLWVAGGKLWVADIDSVWVFDLKSRKGRKVALPGAKFANDTTVVDDVLYISDTGAKKIYKVAPADFLDIKGDPEVTELATGMSFGPNGLCPLGAGKLCVVGFHFGGPDAGVHSVDSSGKIQSLSKPFGKLDGVAVLEGDTLLITDWKSKSLLKWSPKAAMQTLAKGIAGPADFALAPRDNGVLVVVPDLIKGDLYFIDIRKDK